MVKKIIDWIKANKLTAALILVLAWLLWPRYISPLLYSTSYRSQTNLGVPEAGYGGAGALDMALEKVGTSFPPIEPEAPPTDTTDRMVVTETSMTMVVKNVKNTQAKIIAQTEALGGYMTSSSLTHPEEAPYARVILRVPSDKLDIAMDFFRSLALKIPSEYIQGRDVTDEYVDINAHLESLYATKARYEEIRDKATEVEDLLNVQQHLTSIQQQIDRYKGRQKYLEQTAKLSKITIDLSTDELALPYAAPKGFRPSVIFKYAVRALLGTLASIGEKAIWIGVYSVLWGPVLLVIVWYRRKVRKTKSDNQNQQ